MAAGGFEQDVERRARRLEAKLLRDCRLLEELHLRGLPGQPGSAQQTAALAELLVSVHQRPGELRARARLVLAADARLSGATDYAAALLASETFSNPAALSAACRERFLARVAAGTDAEEEWAALQPLTGLELAQRVQLLTARLQQLVEQRRLFEAGELSSASFLEALAESPQVAKESAALAFRALAGLAQAEERLSEALALLDKALRLVGEVEYARHPSLRDLLLRLHREKIELLGAETLGRSLLLALNDRVTALLELAEKDAEAALRSQLLEALDEAAGQWAAAGCVAEALLLRQKHLQLFLEAFGEFNPTVANARAQLGALLLAAERPVEAEEQQRLARNLRRDLGEPGKTQKVSQRLAAPRTISAHPPTRFKPA